MTQYQTDIARAADSPLTPSPDVLARMQREMWARHKVAAWQGAPIGRLSAAMMTRGNARTVERAV